MALAAMKDLNPEQQRKLILNLISKDPELAKQLLQGLFEFEDIATLAKADFKFLWFEIPRKIWHLALRGASNDLLLFVRSCQTERAFNELIDELKNLGPQPKSKVLEAQKQLIDEITALAKQGRVHLPKK
ncbi:MAG: FliG C-terminal domain-containing protein [Pseudobdellovibrio sp.]